MFPFIKRKQNLRTLAILQPTGYFLPASCEVHIRQPGEKGSPEQDVRVAVAASCLAGAQFWGRGTPMLVLEVRNTSNEVISLADNNVINETFHKSIPLHWFQGTQNLLTADLNLNERLTVSTFKSLIVILQHTGNLIPEILHLFICLKKCLLNQKSLSHSWTSKKSKRFKNNNYTKDMRKFRRKTLVSLTSSHAAL